MQVSSQQREEKVDHMTGCVQRRGMNWELETGQSFLVHRNSFWLTVCLDSLHSGCASFTLQLHLSQDHRRDA